MESRTMELTISWRGRIQYKRHHILQVLGSRKSRERNELENAIETFKVSDHAPDLVVFLQDSDYQSVMDIIIDREVSPRSELSLKDISSKFQAPIHRTDNIGDIEEEIQRIVSRTFYVAALQFQVGDSISMNAMEPTVAKPIDDKSHSSEDSSNSEAESGSTIHIPDSSLPTLSSLEEFSEDPKCQQRHKTEDNMSRSLKGPSPSFVNELANGDCGSFPVWNIDSIMES